MTAPRSQFITAPDGLKLHVRLFGELVTDHVPVVCLPGLARTAADFETLAGALSVAPKRPCLVVAMDYRGRGCSDYDANPQNYNLATELSDLLAVSTALGIGPAVFVGTSRGGLLAMLLATARPAAIAGVVLNDIGPVVELNGLLRIKSYVGKLPQPRTFEEGAELLRQLFAAQFPKLSAADWMAFARRTFKEQNGRLAATYDPNLAQTLDGIDPQRPLPPLWDAFDALKDVPIMAIRGANSDVLSAETVVAMSARRPDLEVVVIPDQGHAPLLVEDFIIDRIAAFAARCELSPRR